MSNERLTRGIEDLERRLKDSTISFVMAVNAWMEVQKVLHPEHVDKIDEIINDTGTHWNAVAR